MAHRAPLSMGFSRQGEWSGLPCPPPGDLPNPGIELGSSTLQADSLLSKPPGEALWPAETQTNFQASVRWRERHTWEESLLEWAEFRAQGTTSVPPDACGGGPSTSFLLTPAIPHSLASEHLIPSLLNTLHSDLKESF